MIGKRLKLDVYKVLLILYILVARDHQFKTSSLRKIKKLTVAHPGPSKHSAS